MKVFSLKPHLFCLGEILFIVGSATELAENMGKIAIINGRGKAGHDLVVKSVEDKLVTIRRVKGSLTFPANFQLVGTLNPLTCSF